MRQDAHPMVAIKCSGFHPAPPFERSASGQFGGVGFMAWSARPKPTLRSHSWGLVSDDLSARLHPTDKPDSFKLDGVRLGHS
jgi:hypothetical protein